MSLSNQIISRPSHDGFYLPTEWCRHARTWLAWPGAASKALPQTDSFKTDVEHNVKAAREFEPVTVLVCAGDRSEVYERCGRRVDVMDIAHCSARIRDTGPTFLIDVKGGSAAIDWMFVGWASRAEN
jgi:agmatine deiminase